LNWTEAQKRQPTNYKPGLILEFHKATKGVKKNEALEFVRADKDSITARNPAGQEVRLSQRQAKAFSVFERQTFEVAAGDRLLLQANWRDKSFRATNGQLATVASIEGGRVQLEDGRTIPATYRQIDHGYAVTAHRSQGKTVDSVVISGDRMAQDLFYVAATRGRESLTVITSDKEQLRESIGISSERQSATELAKRLRPNTTDVARLRYAFHAVNEQLFVSRQVQQRQIPAIERLPPQEVYRHGHSISM
jgi:ATP-dependent exoDNAse (exonuclease V) alpha subunit